MRAFCWYYNFLLFAESHLYRGGKFHRLAGATIRFVRTFITVTHPFPPKIIYCVGKFILLAAVDFIHVPLRTKPPSVISFSIEKRSAMLLDLSSNATMEGIEGKQLKMEGLQDVLYHARRMFLLRHAC